MVDATPRSDVAVRRLPGCSAAGAGAGGAAGAGSAGLMGSPGMGPPDHINVLAGELLVAPTDNDLPQAWQKLSGREAPGFGAGTGAWQ